jgi:catechol 2,3-dioxygenase-like lactoylglutathione lyase family enzyme
MRMFAFSLLALVLVRPVHAQLFPPNQAGITMGHIHLNVRNIEAHRKFWVDVFGAIPLRRDGLDGVKIPGWLILFRQQEPTGGTEGSTLDHFGLKVRNLADVLKRTRAGGYQVAREFTGSEGFPNAYVMEPDGVKIELQQDTTQPVAVEGQHLHYFVSNENALRAWYVKTLFFQETVRGRHLGADIPGLNLSFQTTRPQPPVGTKGRAVDHVGFEVKNLEAICRQLEAAGVRLDAPYQKYPSLGIATAFLTDPVGLYIELTEGLDAY